MSTQPEFVAADDAARVMKLVERARQPGKSVDDVKSLYAEWAEDYDRDVSKVNYDAPEISAKILAELFSPGERTTAKVLDLAAGTGLGGVHLINYGFTNVDATDISQEMLDIAAEKKVYTGLILAKFGTEPTDIPAGTYDALVGVGCFTTDHLNHTCFPEIRRVVRPGGKIIFVMRASDLATKPEFRDHFEQQIKTDATHKLWKLLNRMDSKYYDNHNGVVFVIENGSNQVSSSLDR